MIWLTWSGPIRSDLDHLASQSSHSLHASLSPGADRHSQLFTLTVCQKRPQKRPSCMDGTKKYMTTFYPLRTMTWIFASGRCKLQVLEPIMANREVAGSERGLEGDATWLTNSNNASPSALFCVWFPTSAASHHGPILMSPAAIISIPGAQLSICSARINTAAPLRLPRHDRWRTIKLNADSH